MANRSSGIPYTPSGSTSTIGRYISKVLAPPKQRKQSLLSPENSNQKKAINLKNQITTTQTRNLSTVNPPPTRIHSTLATYYKKLKQGSLLPSRNSPVILTPQVPNQPHPTQQVCFLEAPNFQYQKKVHFLLHLDLKAKPKKNHYPRPLPSLRDPYKPLQYPLQLSQRHHQY